MVTSPLVPLRVKSEGWQLPRWSRLTPGIIKLLPLLVSEAL